jgi:hypothetical protein
VHDEELSQWVVKQPSRRIRFGKRIGVTAWLHGDVEREMFLLKRKK